MSAYFTCPVCGEDVKVGAHSCPGCGADERTGLHGNVAPYDGAGLPDDDFDYKEFVDKEFGEGPARSRRELFIGIVALVLIVIFVLTFVL